MSEKERFIIKHGRFGAYFYDTLIGADVDLPSILKMLNAKDFFESEEKGSEYDQEIEDFGKISQEYENKSGLLSKVPEKESTKKLKVTEEVIEEEIITEVVISNEFEYHGKTYDLSKGNPCKYKCGMLTIWGQPYEKGDKILHVSPVSKEIIGYTCPRYKS